MGTAEKAIHCSEISTAGEARGDTAKDAVAASKAATPSTSVKKTMATGRIVRGDSSLENWLEDMERPPKCWLAAIGFGFRTPARNELFLAKQAGFGIYQAARTFLPHPP